MSALPLSALPLAKAKLLPKQSKMGKNRDRTQWGDILKKIVMWNAGQMA